MVWVVVQNSLWFQTCGILLWWACLGEWHHCLRPCLHTSFHLAQTAVQGSPFANFSKASLSFSVFPAGQGSYDVMTHTMRSSFESKLLWPWSSLYWYWTGRNVGNEKFSFYLSWQSSIVFILLICHCWRWVVAMALFVCQLPTEWMVWMWMIWSKMQAFCDDEKPGKKIYFWNSSVCQSWYT